MEDRVDVSGWSDEQLLRECVRCGEEARRWRSKFLGLLPEVYQRRLYEKHGCSSVFEFAYKVGGVSEEQVSRVLNLHRRFEKMPILRGLLISGVTSVNKIARVAAMATPENEALLADKVQLLSQAAVETFVRDMREMKTEVVRAHKPQLIQETVQVTVQLDPEVANELLDLRNRGVNIDRELRVFLEKRREEIEHEKMGIAKECAERGGIVDENPTRYIPQKIRKILAQEHGTKCSITTCKKSSQQIHHTRRYSLDPSHNPRFLAPLCKAHHEIAHVKDVMAQEMRRR
jgi:hypothetical protein